MITTQFQQIIIEALTRRKTVYSRPPHGIKRNLKLKFLFKLSNNSIQLNVSFKILEIIRHSKMLLLRTHDEFFRILTLAFRNSWDTQSDICFRLMAVSTDAYSAPLSLTARTTSSTRSCCSPANIFILKTVVARSSFAFCSTSRVIRAFFGGGGAGSDCSSGAG